MTIVASHYKEAVDQESGQIKINTTAEAIQYYGIIVIIIIIALIISLSIVVAAMSEASKKR